MLDVVVSAASAPSRLISYKGLPLTSFMADLHIDPNYSAAVAVLSSEVTSVTVSSAEELLSTIN
jgi:hypothetical protein